MDLINMFPMAVQSDEMVVILLQTVNDTTWLVAFFWYLIFEMVYLNKTINGFFPCRSLCKDKSNRNSANNIDDLKETDKKIEKINSWRDKKVENSDSENGKKVEKTYKESDKKVEKNNHPIPSIVFTSFC